MIGPNVVTLDQEEFNDICRRVHSMLMNRADKAREKKEKRPTKRATDNHIEASKEVFVFVHLMELVEGMAEEIADLRNMVSFISANSEDHQNEHQIMKIFSSSKKSYLN